MPITKLPPLSEVKTVRLENDDVYLDIERTTGFVRSMFFKNRKVDLFAQLRQNIPGYIGGLRVFDERDNRWYEDLNSPFALRKFAQRDNAVTFTKAFRGAPFILEVTLRLEADALHWEVQGRKKDANVADRSLRVYFSLPLIAGWNVWGPCLAGEQTFDGMTPFAFMHLQQPYVSDYDIILPMVSHFSKPLDVGYSMLEPLEAQVPAAKFQFCNDKCFNWGTMEKQLDRAPVLEAVNYYIGLVGERPMNTKIIVLFHEGDWRPALGKVFQKWNRLFVPPNPRMYEHEGIFSGCMAGALQGHIWSEWDRKTVESWVRGHVKTFEVHGHFEYYADYFQDGKDEWLDLRVYEHLFRRTWEGKKNAQEVFEWVRGHSDREIAAQITGKKPEDFTPEEAHAALWTTRAGVHQVIDELADAGISPFWYFNYTDGFRPVVEERWPDAICKNEDGTPTPSGWMMCHCLNSDPRYPFGRFQIESARKIIDEYPRIAGFFLDCFRHFEVEFGHDDGITVVNNKPAYSVNFSYDAIEGTIKKMLHEKGMCTFCNKPQTLRTMTWVDGVMLEGGGDRLEEKYFWACLAKPMVFLWTSNESSDDENCRRAVLHGCFPKAGADEAGLARRGRYLPLYEAFRRRVFCFEPDPLRVPKGCRGKLYTLGDDYVAGIVNLNIEEGMALTYAKPPYAMFRVRRGHDVTRVGIMTPGDKDWRFMHFKFNGTFLAVPLEGFSNCAVVRLFVTGDSGKAIGPERFQGAVDSCGDPDSSFTDLSSL